MKKTLAFFLAVLFVFGSFGNIFAGSVTETERPPEPEKSENTEPTREVYSGTCGDNLTWTLDTSTGLLEISGTGAMNNWALSVSDSTLAPWYSYRSSVKKVCIGNGVTSIGNHAFRGCSSLTSVTIGNSVTSIGFVVFAGCSSLTSLSIPSSVTSMNKQPFGYCSSLTSISVDANNMTYSSLAGVLFNKDRSVLICYPDGKTGTYTIPSSVTSIGDNAFDSCKSLTSVAIPNSLTSIGSYAFFSCSSLNSVSIPDNVTKIGGDAFLDCSSLTAAIFCGAPPSTFGGSVFDLCASDFCIYYTAAHASEWAPNGETTWKGYPISCTYGSDTCLLRFYLNDGSGTYSTIIVNKGDRVKFPVDPTRKGYRFGGWYTNDLCTGAAYCNQSNNYEGGRVYSNLKFYANWKPGSLDPSIDWYSFINSGSYFYSSLISPKREKLITGEFYSALLEAFNNNQSELEKCLKEEWDGSCFGMSAVASLIAANRLSPSFFQDGCANTHGFNPPKSNPTVRNLIEYYQLIYDSPRTRVLASYNEARNCESIINAIDNSNYPIVVLFHAFNKNVTISAETYDQYLFGHAVVACGYTLTENAYKINIADPRITDRYIHLSIERDTFRNLGFDDTRYDNTTMKSFIESGLTVESLAYDYQNIQDYLTGKGYTSGAAARDIEDEVYTTLTANFDSFRIDGPNGAYAVIEYGEKTEGDLDIGPGQCMNEIGSELQLEFDVPVLAEGASYTITPEECYSVVTENSLEEYHASLVCSGENGFWADSTAGSGAEFVFGSDGSVSATCAEPGAQSATVCRNDMTTDWSCVTVESAETAAIRAVPSCDSVTIIADPDAEYDITVSSFHNDAVFEGIVGGSAGVTVTEDEHKNAVITYNESSDIAASGVFGCSLIFCTMGGSEIETQTGIVPGTTATAPEDPTRTGMIFGGWYTTYECEEGSEWSFDTPVTEDTYIYAKWEEDENYIHSVTFHIEDGFDTIYYLYNGEALEDYELPEIPECVGYTAEWPEFDVSCVTEDIVIEPIYTPIPYTVTFVDSDGTVIEEQVVDYGTGAEAPEPPVHSGLVFIGWDTDYSLITGDTTVTAVYGPNHGDIDADGSISMADVSLLSMFLNGESPVVSDVGRANADTNGDGVVDIRDIAAIYAIIANS